MRPFLAMIKANLKMTVRNRQALFWNLAFPAIFILIFGAVFDNNDGVNFNVGIAGEQSPYRDAVVQALESSDSFDVHVGEVDDEEDELKDYDREYVLVFRAPVEAQFMTPVDIAYDETLGPNANVGLSLLSQILMGVGGG